MTIDNHQWAIDITIITTSFFGIDQGSFVISDTFHNAALLTAPSHQIWIKSGLHKFTTFEKLQKCVKQGSGFFSHLMHLQKSYIPDTSSC